MDAGRVDVREARLCGAEGRRVTLKIRDAARWDEEGVAKLVEACGLQRLVLDFTAVFKTPFDDSSPRPHYHYGLEGGVIGQWGFPAELFS